MQKRYGRSQKYHPRKRYLYALLFHNGCAYIGQSVDPTEREKQHRRRAGGWCGRPFKCIPLGSIVGTEAEAADYEHAWRHRASMSGWKIYAKPPGIVVNPRRQMSAKRYAISYKLRWPSEHGRSQVGRMAGWLVLASALTYGVSRLFL